jgi:ABC-type glycerol-3-phosphate transport system substrate-binding protein
MKRIGLLLAVIVLIAGCTPGDRSPELAAPTATPAGGEAQPATAEPAEAIPATVAPAGEAVTISFAAYDSERSYFGPLIERFNQDNPGIKVTFASIDDIVQPVASAPDFYKQQMRLIVSAADTAAARNPRPEDISYGYLLDLKPLMDADPSFDRDDFYPSALDQFSRNGGVYLVPQFIGINLLAYNRDMWTKKGLALPKPDWTMTDMLAAAEQLATRRGDEVAVYGTLRDEPLGILLYELASAGDDLSAIPPEQVRLDQPEVAAALERVVALAKSGAIYAPPPPPEGQGRSDDYQGMIYDQRAGMWAPETTYWGGRSGDPPFTVGLASYPPWPTMYPTTDGYIISSGTQHPQEAWRWLAFLSKQPPSSYYEYHRPDDARNLPARKSIAEQAGYWKNLDAEAKAAVEAVLARPTRPLAETFDTPVFEPLNHAIEAVLRGKQTPTEALRAAQAQLEEQIAQARLTPQPAAASAPIVVATPRAAAAAPGATTVVFGAPLGGDTDVPRAFAKTFNQQHPEVFVDVRASDAQTPDTLAAQSDCFTWYAPLETQAITAALDLQPLVDADAGFPLDDYPAALLAPFRRAGALYGLPSSVSVRMLAYNQAAFDAAGLPHPAAGWTLDDLAEAAQRLTRGAGENKQYGFAAPSGHTGDIRFFLQSFGAALAKGSGAAEEPNFTDPKVAQAVRAYLGLLRAASPHKHIQGYTRQWVPDAEQLIRQGHVAMWFDYGFEVGSMPKQPSAGLNVAVAPPPLGSRPLFLHDFQVSGMFISAQTQHREACWVWLKALSEQAATAVGMFPARSSVAESAAFRAQALPGAADVYKAYRAAFDRTPDTPGEIAPNQSPIDFYWFYRAVDRALAGQDLERELADAQGLTEQYLACVRAGTSAVACAKQVDPQYQGWRSAPQP